MTFENNTRQFSFQEFSEVLQRSMNELDIDVQL